MIFNSIKFNEMEVFCIAENRVWVLKATELVFYGALAYRRNLGTI